MSFFQNPFPNDFEGNWLLGDRHLIPTFRVGPNTGRGQEYVFNWAEGPFDLSGNDPAGNATDKLYIIWAPRSGVTSGVDFKNWSTIEVDITQTAASSSSVTSSDIITDLNNNAIFSERFDAMLDDGRVAIRQKKDITEMHFYIRNGNAEDVLQFNQKAGIAEIPTFFARHTIENRFTFEDSQNHLIELDASNAVDAKLIDNAVDVRGNSLGFDSSTVREDWELLEGRSGIFEFTNSVDSTTTVIYSAGSKVGDLARKIIEVSGNTFNLPHTLESSDLITPP